MTSQITTLDPVSNPTDTKTILANDALKSSLLTLAPGDETPRQELNGRGDQLLFVIEGEVTISLGEVNTILAKDQAVLLRKDRAHVIAGSLDGWTKLLQVEIPPREPAGPEIITLDR